MRNTLVRVVGWPATILHGDPSVFDRWRWIRRQLLPGPLRTLDAGCGAGAFTLYAAKIGNEAIGLSFDDENNRIAAERAHLLRLANVKFLTADLRRLEEVSQDLGKFDQIICTEVIEHILDDRKLLRDLSGLLKNGGRLILTTPFKHGRPIFGDKVSEIEDGGHVRVGYTHEEIQAMFNEMGLELITQDYICGVVSQKIVELMRRLSSIGHKFDWAITFPLRIFQPADVILTKATGYPFYVIGALGIKS
jgi:cyclopropane fatty-acyl-phospholipid synthase-like methyltransferase